MAGKMRLLTKHLTAVASIATVISIFYGCTARYVPSSEFGNMNAADRVLIATVGTDFKDAVVEKVTQELAEEDVYVRIIDLKAIENTDTQQFDAIVLFNTCTAWMVDYHVTDFLRAADESEKEWIVVLTTAADPDWEAGNLDVDAISSASVPEQISPMANKILVRIRRLLAAR